MVYLLKHLKDHLIVLVQKCYMMKGLSIAFEFYLPAGKSSLTLNGIFLYTVDFLFQVECCIRQL